ncbi:MAG: RimK family alpha-L-glutamate ligase [Phormidesmis sp.]
MKLLSLCDPTQYKRPPLDVPAFYQKLASDKRVTFYHMPAPDVTAVGELLPDVRAIATPNSLTYNEFVTLGNSTSQTLSLEDIDLVFCRTLKPYAPTYLNKLSQWENFTQFVNSPSSKQRQMAANFLLSIAESYMPETIVTARCDEAHQFFEQHQVIVAKTENSTGGRGVFKIYYENGQYCVDNILTGIGTFANFSKVMGFLQSDCVSGSCEAIQFSRYLPNTLAGDKRVVVVDGEIYGSYLRKSKSGHWVNNVSADGTCTLADISANEREAIAQTVGHYQQMGLHTLGYDFLMDDDGTWRISEINAGNIGGFARLEQLTGEPVMNRLIDWLLAFANAHRSIQNSVQRSVNDAPETAAKAAPKAPPKAPPEKTLTSREFSEDSHLAYAYSR